MEYTATFGGIAAAYRRGRREGALKNCRPVRGEGESIPAPKRGSPSVRNIRHFDEFGFGIMLFQKFHEFLVVIPFIRLFIRFEQPSDFFFFQCAAEIIGLFFVVEDPVIEVRCSCRHCVNPFPE
jgi:hypothetical protein